MIPNSYYKDSESTQTSNSVNADADITNNFENSINPGSMVSSYRHDKSSLEPSFSGTSKYKKDLEKRAQLLDSYTVLDDPSSGDNDNKGYAESQLSKYSDKYTTSNLIEVRNTLNTLKQSAKPMHLIANEEETEDRFYFDDDDTKVVIVKSL